MTGTAAQTKRRNELAHRYLTEGATPPRRAAAIGLGLFIGCLPVYGLHLPLCLLVGWAFGLNRLKLYLAANISNPVLSPLLVFTAVQVAGRLRHGHFYALSLDTFGRSSPWQFGTDLLWGSALLGIGLGTIGFLVTYKMKRRFALSLDEARLVDETAKRYLPFGIFRWWRADRRLHREPAYREIALGRVVPLEGALLDVACGWGLLLASIGTQRALEGKPTPALLGIEKEAGAHSIASQALDGEATIVQEEASTAVFPRCRVLVLLDDRDRFAFEHERKLFVEKAAGCIEEGGVILIRPRDGEGERWRGLLSTLGLATDEVRIPGGRDLLRARKPGAPRADALTPS